MKKLTIKTKTRATSESNLCDCSIINEMICGFATAATEWRKRPLMRVPTISLSLSRVLFSHKSVRKDMWQKLIAVVPIRPIVFSRQQQEKKRKRINRQTNRFGGFQLSLHLPQPSLLPLLLVLSSILTIIMALELDSVELPILSPFNICLNLIRPLKVDSLLLFLSQRAICWFLFASIFV